MKTQTVLSLAFGALAANACLLDEEIEAEHTFRIEGIRPLRMTWSKRQEQEIELFPVGDGDRFEDGQRYPIGVGVNDRNFSSILNTQEVRSALKGLSNVYDDVKLFTPPFRTYENQTLPGAIIGEDPRVFLMSGIHARERGGPDNVILFVSDLLRARELGTGITYGDKKYSKQDVELALSAGIVLLPMTNPDGIAFDQKSDTCWRKNRNPRSSKNKKEGDSDIGIDLNRNFDFLFDYEKAYSEYAEISGAGSDDPKSEVFHGPAAFSEAETQAIAWTMEKFDGLSWFLDLHSYGGHVMYSWCDDNAQFTNKTQSFLNRDLDGTRGFLGDDPPEAYYKEYMEEKDQEDEIAIAEKMSDSMNTVGKVDYQALECVGLYPTSGASTDYAHSLYYGQQCGGQKLKSLTVEFGLVSRSGGACPFYPTQAEYMDSVRTVGAGLMELMMNAAGEAGEPETYQCKEGEKKKEKKKEKKGKKKNRTEKETVKGDEPHDLKMKMAEPGEAKVVPGDGAMGPMLRRIELLRSFGERMGF